jgi:hypothetical protein
VCFPCVLGATDPTGPLFPPRRSSSSISPPARNPQNVTPKTNRPGARVARSRLAFLSPSFPPFPPSALASLPVPVCAALLPPAPASSPDPPEPRATSGRSPGLHPPLAPRRSARPCPSGSRFLGPPPSHNFFPCPLLPRPPSHFLPSSRPQPSHPPLPPCHLPINRPPRPPVFRTESAADHSGPHASSTFRHHLSRIRFLTVLAARPKPSGVPSRPSPASSKRRASSPFATRPRHHHA